MGARNPSSFGLILVVILLLIAGLSCAQGRSNPPDINGPSATTAHSNLEIQAMNMFRRCMREGGLSVQDITFEIEGRRLIDWNGNFPGQGTIDADNVHNACIRKLIDELDLDAQLP